MPNAFLEDNLTACSPFHWYRRKQAPKAAMPPGCFLPNRENGPPIEEPSGEITNLLRAWSGGDPAALDRLAEQVYPELRRMARRYMKNERQANTLQSTALVHEVYLRLVDVRKVDWRERAQFYAMAAQMMRRILVDFARERQCLKHGGDTLQVSLGEAASFVVHRNTDLVALAEALTALAEIDPRKVRVVEMRFFAGLSVEEVADVLKVSKETVMRDWRLAKVWLLRELEGEAVAREK